MTEYQNPFQPEPPPAPEPTRQRRWLVPALAATGGAVVLALAVVTTLLVTKDDSAPPAAAPSATHTVHPVPVPAAPTSEDRSLFNQFMVKEGFTSYATLHDLDSLASGVCVGFDAGLTMPMILDSVSSMNWGPSMDGRFVGFAVASHCPEHSGDVQ